MLIDPFKFSKITSDKFFWFDQNKFGNNVYMYSTKYLSQRKNSRGLGLLIFILFWNSEIFIFSKVHTFFTKIFEEWKPKFSNREISDFIDKFLTNRGFPFFSKICFQKYFLTTSIAGANKKLIYIRENLSLKNKKIFDFLAKISKVAGMKIKRPNSTFSLLSNQRISSNKKIYWEISKTLQAPNKVKKKLGGQKMSRTLEKLMMERSFFIPSKVFKEIKSFFQKNPKEKPKPSNKKRKILILFFNYRNYTLIFLPGILDRRKYKKSIYEIQNSSNFRPKILQFKVWKKSDFLFKKYF